MNKRSVSPCWKLIIHMAVIFHFCDEITESFLSRFRGRGKEKCNRHICYRFSSPTIIFHSSGITYGTITAFRKFWHAHISTITSEKCFTCFSDHFVFEPPKWLVRCRNAKKRPGPTFHKILPGNFFPLSHFDNSLFLKEVLKPNNCQWRFLGDSQFQRFGLIRMRTPEAADWIFYSFLTPRATTIISVGHFSSSPRDTTIEYSYFPLIKTINYIFFTAWRKQDLG